MCFWRLTRCTHLSHTQFFKKCFSWFLKVLRHSYNSHLSVHYIKLSYLYKNITEWRASNMEKKEKSNRFGVMYVSMNTNKHCDLLWLFLQSQYKFSGYQISSLKYLINHCSTTGKPTHLFRTKCVSLDSV